MNTNYKEKLTCRQFIDQSSALQETLDQYIQESYWTDDFSVDVAWQIMTKQADKEDVILTDEEDFDYNEEFYETYKATEKGLS